MISGRRSKMYGVVFTSLLVLILCWKTYKLMKNKRNSGDFEGIDDELVIMLNEGDSIG
jgi:hypothetical protein